MKIRVSESFQMLNQVQHDGFYHDVISNLLQNLLTTFREILKRVQDENV